MKRLARLLELPQVQGHIPGDPLVGRLCAPWVGWTLGLATAVATVLALVLR